MQEYIKKINKCNIKAIRLLCLLIMILTASGAVFGQQTRQISGVVNDADGLPMPGVTVLEKGTTNGTVTNGNGQYVITVSGNNDMVLVFSFVGYQQQEFTVGDMRTINVKLSESVQEIEEVVIVGYGIQKKESIVGAIVQATEKELKRTGNVSDFATALVGNLPGLVSLTSSGEPGGTGWGQSATEIYIRGKNTWNSSQPLILIDGVERELNHVDVNEVSSISVLKDASATAVFGVKGANGVILINTKRGYVGKPKLNVSYTSTAQLLAKVPKTLDSYDALMARNESIEREVNLMPNSWSEIIPYEIVQQYRDYPGRPEEYKYIYPNIDWEKEMFKKMGFSHHANLNIQGGNKLAQYFGSFSYLHDGDMIKHYDNGKGYKPTYDFDRLNFRSNVDFQATSTTKIGINFDGFFSVKNQNWANTGSGQDTHPNSWVWSVLYGMAPDVFPVQFPDGSWGIYEDLGGSTQNPSAVFHNMGIMQNRTTSLNTMISVEQDLKFITQGLKATGRISFNNSISSEGGLYDVSNSTRAGEGGNVPYTRLIPDWSDDTGGVGKYIEVHLPEATGDYAWTLRPWSLRPETISLVNFRSKLPVTRNLMYEFQLNYARRFAQKHNAGATGVFKREETATGSDFKHYREDWVFRGTYDYDSRYFIEFNGAYNGSEQFGPGYRFAFFPSLGLSWYVSNEKFFSGIEWVDRLKFRYSIGKIGSDRISDDRWLYNSQYAYGGNARLGGEQILSDIVSPYTIYRPTVIGNPQLRWETARISNYAVEFEILKNLISLEFDYFTEDRTDIFIRGTNRTILPYFGFTVPPANAGRVKTQGFEAVLGVNKQIQSLFLWGKFVLTHSKNKVIFRDDGELLEKHRKSAGFQLDQRKDVLSEGYYYNNWDDIYASAPLDAFDEQKLPGYYFEVDYNGDGRIRGQDDSVPHGYSEVPQNTGTLTLGASYKGWDFSIQFFGVNNATRSVSYPNYRNNTNVISDRHADYWSKDNQNASAYLPRWRANTISLGDFWVYDASYVRLRNVELAYSFSKTEFLRKVSIDNVRIFLNGIDLFFWSDLPDDRQTSGNLGNNVYPTTRKINLGIELSF